MSVADVSMFAGMEWTVHKFGGTSVANAECFLQVAQIVEDNLGPVPSDEETSRGPNLTIVVSAMGGKPKTTDLLLSMVQSAANRDDAAVHVAIENILEKHITCLEILFSDLPSERDRLLQVVRSDLKDIQDILRTVSLMKWHAQPISELVSGYGELWSTQILAALLKMRSQRRENMKLKSLNDESSGMPHSALSSVDSSSSLHNLRDDYSVDQEERSSLASSNLQVTHEFVYVDARRVIVIDEEAIQNGIVCWDVSQAQLQDVYQEAYSMVHPKSVLHLVMTGYVASNTHGVATTLQRDGSDYSAAILGRLLSATQINIWTDVDGCLSADPRRVPGAYVIPDISYDEASELSYFGAKVIHPKTMQPAISATPQIPIYIRNTFNSKFRGTRIYITSTTVGGDSEKCVCGFSSIDNIALVNVEGTGMIGVPGVANRLFGTLEKVNVNVILISQASSEHSITFATLENNVEKAKAALEEEFRREIAANRISDIDVKMPCSIIAAVGDGMAHVAGVSGRFFSALGAAKINVVAISQGCSERNISAVVRTEESTRALRAIHAAFRLGHTMVRVGIVGVNNEVGKSLLRLLESQREKLRRTFDIDLQVCVAVPDSSSDKIVVLNKPTTTSSITNSVYQDAVSGEPMSDSSVSFRGESKQIAKAIKGGLCALEEGLYQEESTSHVVFDCTSDIEVSKLHAAWLRRGINIVTANNTALADQEQREKIREAEKCHGKLSAHYLREVTVGGALPIINTLHNLLDSGDRIRRVDGILSVSLSFIMFKISPPPRGARCSEFDEDFSHGAFQGDLSLASQRNAPKDEPYLFSEAIKEAMALGLMEEDPTMDLNNNYTARNLIVLAQELGVEQNISLEMIQDSSEKLLQVCSSDGHIPSDYRSLLSGAMDDQIKTRVDAARERGCVLRHICSVNVKERDLAINIVEIPDNHVFALTPPSCECVRFFTHRHRAYPLIVQGPSAGVDSTASALLAELLRLLREKMGPRRVVLSKAGSSATLADTGEQGIV